MFARKLHQDIYIAAIPLLGGIYARLPVARGEQLRLLVDAFGRTEEQVAAGLQCVVKEREELLLHVPLKIDQQVPAGDKVEMNEGWILERAVMGEEHHVPDLLPDPVVRALVDEKPPQPVWRDIGLDGLRVAPFARGGERPCVEIGAENLHRGHHLPPFRLLDHHHGEAVGLLARGAAGRPDPDISAPLEIAQERPQRVFNQYLEGGGVAKEGGDRDQQIAE